MVVGRGNSVVQQQQSGSGSYTRVSEPGLECEVKEGPYGIERVVVKYEAGGISMSLSDSGEVFIGRKSASPNIAGPLRIGGLEDALNVELPFGESRMEIEIKAKYGVSGVVAHKGAISTQNGNIALNLGTPLTVYAEAAVAVSVQGMNEIGKGLYEPLSGKSAGMLKLNAPKGSISVKYEPSHSR